MNNEIKKVKKVMPISPDEITPPELPDWVIEGANDCIKTYWKAKEKKAHFTQDALIACLRTAYLKKYPNVADYKEWRGLLFRNHYLDIEPVYEEVGWNIIYDKPGYCESGEPTFTFTKK